MGKQKKHEPDFIFEVKEFCDERGRHIQERVTVWGEAPANFARFIAEGAIQMQVAGKTLQETIWAPLYGVKTIEGAFRAMDHRLDKVGKAKGKELKAEVEKVREKARRRVRGVTGEMLDSSGRLRGHGRG